MPPHIFDYQTTSFLEVKRQRSPLPHSFTSNVNPSIQKTEDHRCPSLPWSKPRPGRCLRRRHSFLHPPNHRRPRNKILRNNRRHKPPPLQQNLRRINNLQKFNHSRWDTSGDIKRSSCAGITRTWERFYGAEFKV